MPNVQRKVQNPRLPDGVFLAAAWFNKSVESFKYVVIDARDRKPIGPINYVRVNKKLKMLNETERLMSTDL